jgi:DNA-directed RNA polymerase sigma subunit (sigma70/sigma32)
LLQDDAQVPPRNELPTVTLDAFGEGELLDLDDRTAHILRMRSGMVDGRRYPLWEIGQEIGLQQERVRQLQNQGLMVVRQIREVQRHMRSEPVIRARFRWRTFG